MSTITASLEARARRLSWVALAALAIAATMLVIGLFAPMRWLALGALVPLLVAGAAMLSLQSSRQGDQEVASEQRDRTSNRLQEMQQELDRHSQLERELVQAKQAAESAVLAKGEFLATMSHEIRTPLNGIVPMLDLLMHANMPVDQTELVRTAYSSSQQMLRIVDDILDYSKLEAEKLDLETVGFNLRDVLQSVIMLMERPAEAKGLRLSLNIDPGVRLPVRGDPVRLRQVLSNLLSNAVKFTERGSVALDVRRIGESAAQHQLRFEVRDSGIGISPEAQKQLFQAFTQADASTTRLYGGTGLGLAICRRIVSLMGGRIGVDSQPGSGSTFWFEIPLLKVQGDMPSREADLTGGRVLLLTNDQRLRMRLSMLLPNWGLRITTAETTQDALERLRAGAAQGRPWTYNAVVADYPAIRGTALALVRNLERKAQYGDVHLLMLHGDELPPEELRPQVQLLSRTAPDPDLRAALAEQPEQRTRVVAAAPSQVAPRPARPQQVLLVEDNPVNLAVAQRLLQVLGVECDTAGNGQAAIEKMQAKAYDLVLMDCQMPVLDGYAATRQWREREGPIPHRLPIVAMTANAMAGDRQKCLEAGMDDYLAKPVTRDELSGCLERWRRITDERALDRMAAPAAEATAASAPTAASPPLQAAPVAPAAPAGPLLQMGVLNELRELLGTAGVAQIVEMYLADAPRLIAQLESAALSNDMGTLRSVSHTLKSSSANVGAQALSDAAKALEHGIRDNSVERPELHVARIVEEFTRVQPSLRVLAAAAPSA